MSESISILEKAISSIVNQKEVISHNDIKVINKLKLAIFTIKLKQTVH